jgi:hypothetical protein
MTDIVDSSLRWAAVAPRGRVHAMRPHWDQTETTPPESRVWAPLCATRNYYREKGLFGLSTDPHEGTNGACKQPGCVNGRRLWVGTLESFRKGRKP